jgi:hypothetical protein
VAVTGYFRIKEGEQVSLLLNILELTQPIYNRPYLCNKLLEVTNRLGITYTILVIIRDNTSPNNTILNEFEVYIYE